MAIATTETLAIKKGADTGTMNLIVRGDGGVEFTKANGEKHVAHSNESLRFLVDALKANV